MTRSSRRTVAVDPETDYTAKDIEVLEGLEPVRRRPGMYIGGTDEGAMHHLVAELLDNAMDEAVAGHATFIDLELTADGFVSVRDNGRGIPIDPHPKFKKKSALEVILTTLHSGGKFSGNSYETSGGLHGVGISVVNALSDHLTVEVARDRHLWRQEFARGEPLAPLADLGAVHNRRGTTVTFHPDRLIFGDTTFRPATLFRIARSKAYLFRGVEIRWSCAPELLRNNETTPQEEKLHFPGGLDDYLSFEIEGRRTVTPRVFTGEAEFNSRQNGKRSGRLEWAITWLDEDETTFFNSYCNTIPTPNGGTHEAGLRSGLTRGLKSYGELAKNRRASQITAEDVFGGTCGLLSVFLRDPQFQGQMKERLSSPEATRLVDGVLKDHFEHWLTQDPGAADLLLASVLDRAEERIRKREQKDVARKSATRRLRLPGKLADCTRADATGTEIFLVEGDSAGGSAKQARNRQNQAILALRGKILNVASATTEKLRSNKELSDLTQALGCGTRDSYRDGDLRYERVIIMTDADVDGAHIASLLMTYFYLEMRDLIKNGHLYLAQPPLYRLTQGAKTIYARDDSHREELLKSTFNNRSKVEVSRFKGLGEMPPSQLKSTTMAPATRTLIRIDLESEPETSTDERVRSLMGRHPELRLAFIQDRAGSIQDIDV